MGIIWISPKTRKHQIREVIVKADAALEREGKDSLVPDVVLAGREILAVSLMSCRITCVMSRLGGKVRSQVVFESDHFLHTPTYDTRLSKPKFPKSMHSSFSLPLPLHPV